MKRLKLAAIICFLAIGFSNTATAENHTILYSLNYASLNVLEGAKTKAYLNDRGHPTGLQSSLIWLFSFPTETLFRPVVGLSLNLLLADNSQPFPSISANTRISSEFKSYWFEVHGGGQYLINKDFKLFILGNIAFAENASIKIKVTSDSKFAQSVGLYDSYNNSKYGYGFGLSTLAQYFVSESFAIGGILSFNYHSLVIDYLISLPKEEESVSYLKTTAGILVSYNF